VVVAPTPTGVRPPRGRWVPATSAGVLAAPSPSRAATAWLLSSSRALSLRSAPPFAGRGTPGGSPLCQLPLVARAMRPGLERSRSSQPFHSPGAVPDASGLFPEGSNLPASIDPVSPWHVNAVLPHRAFRAMAGRADSVSTKPLWIRACSRCFPSVRPSTEPAAAGWRMPPRLSLWGSQRGDTMRGRALAPGAESKNKQGRRSSTGKAVRTSLLLVLCLLPESDEVTP